MSTVTEQKQNSFKTNESDESEMENKDSDWETVSMPSEAETKKEKEKEKEPETKIETATISNPDDSLRGHYAVMAAGGGLVNKVEVVANSTPVKIKAFSGHIFEFLKQIVSGSQTTTYANYQALGELRKAALEQEYDEQMIETDGFVPAILKFMKCDNVDFQNEATWLALNLNSRSTCKMIPDVFIDAGIIPILFDLLQHRANELKIHALWTLNNIAGTEDTKYVNMLLEKGIIDIILHQFSDLFNGQDKRDEKLSLVAWSLHNLSKRNPMVDEKYFKQMLPLAIRLLEKSQDHQVVDHCFIFLANMTENNAYPALLKEVIDDEFLLKMIIKFIPSTERDISYSCIRIIGNLVYGDNYNAKVLVDSGILPILNALLTDKQRDLPIRRNVTWTLTNFLHVSKDMTDKVLDSGISETMEMMLRNKTEPDALKRIMFNFFSDLAKQSTPKHLLHLMGYNLSVVKLALDFIEYNQLHWFVRSNQVLGGSPVPAKIKSGMSPEIAAACELIDRQIIDEFKSKLDTFIAASTIATTTTTKPLVEEKKGNSDGKAQSDKMSDAQQNIIVGLSLIKDVIMAIKKHKDSVHLLWIPNNIVFKSAFGPLTSMKNETIIKLVEDILKGVAPL